LASAATDSARSSGACKMNTLAKRGAELIDPIRETPFERFFFRDPNGYVFEVVDANRTPEV